MNHSYSEYVLKQKLQCHLVRQAGDKLSNLCMLTASQFALVNWALDVPQKNHSARHTVYAALLSLRFWCYGLFQCKWPTQSWRLLLLPLNKHYIFRNFFAILTRYDRAARPSSLHNAWVGFELIKLCSELKVRLLVRLIARAEYSQACRLWSYDVICS